MPKILKTDQYRWERSIYIDHGRESGLPFEFPLKEGYIPSFAEGMKIPEEMLSAVPKTILISKVSKRAKFPEKLDDYIWRQVNEPLRDMIEELEPGVHQFFPVGHIDGDTGEKLYTDQNWYMFNIATTLPAMEIIDFEHSNLLGVERKHRENPEKKIIVETTNIDTSFVFPNFGLVFKKDLFPNNHIWRLMSYLALNKVIDGVTYKERVNIRNEIYVSDTFAEEFKKRGFVGMKFYDIPVA